MAFKLLFLFISTTVFAQNTLRTTDFEQSLSAKAPRNYVVNSGIEKNDLSITDASSIAIRNTGSPIEGVASLLINSTASGEKVIFETFPMQAGLANRACESTFVYTLDATLYKAYVEIASVKVSAEVTLTNAGSDARSVSIIFPCGPSGSSPYLVIESLGNGAAIRVDSVYVGEATSIGTVAQAEYVGSVVLAGTDNFTNASVSGLSVYGFVTSTAPTYTFTNGSAVLSAPSANKAGFTANLPAGRYMLNYVGPLRSTGAAGNFCQLRFSDGTNATFAAVMTSTGGSASQSPGLSGVLTYTTGGVREIALQVAQTAVSECGAPIPGSLQAGRIDVYRYPLQSEIVVRGDVTDLSGMARWPATTNCAWTSTSASMASFATDADCTNPTGTNLSGNAAAPATKIPAFVAPTLLPGRYMLQASGRIITSVSTTNTACVYEIYDGTTSGGTGGLTAGSTTSDSASMTISGTFEYNSNQTNKQFQIRAQRITGDGTCIVGAASTDLTFTLIPLSQGLPKPFIPGSVFAGRSSVVRVGVGSVDCLAAGSSIFNNPDGMIATVGNRSTATCIGTFPVGFFSSTPMCFATNGNAGNIWLFTKADASSATAFEVRALTNGDATADFAADILCIGN